MGDQGTAPILLAVVSAYKRAHALVAERFAPLGVHPGQDRLLAELWKRDGVSQSELIKRLGVQPPTVTGALQRLERAGIVRREPDPENRRISRVYLTEKGRELEGPVQEALADAERNLLANLSSDERRELGELLDRLLRRDS